MRNAMNRGFAVVTMLLAAVVVMLGFVPVSSAGTRTLETPFALSSDLRSEFTMRFPLQGDGRVLIEAEWKPLTTNGASVALTMMVIRPDGVITEKKRGISSLRLVHRA